MNAQKLRKAVEVVSCKSLEPHYFGTWQIQLDCQRGSGCSLKSLEDGVSATVGSGSGSGSLTEDTVGSFKIHCCEVLPHVLKTCNTLLHISFLLW